VTRFALTLASGIILAVATWASPAGNAFFPSNRAAEIRASHYGDRGPQEPLGPQPAQGRFFSLGSASCRACHRAIYAAWSLSPHARADTALGEEQQLDPACQRCHAPLPDMDHTVLNTEDAVACETCHGPGSAYSDLAVMIDPLKRREAGLLDAGQSCRGCHNSGHSDHVERNLGAESRRVHPAPPIRTVQR